MLSLYCVVGVLRRCGELIVVTLLIPLAAKVRKAGRKRIGVVEEVYLRTEDLVVVNSFDVVLLVKFEVEPRGGEPPFLTTLVGKAELLNVWVGGGSKASLCSSDLRHQR